MSGSFEEIVENAGGGDGGLPPYFAVSLLKFSVMCFFTFGTYKYWWYYNNWRRIKARTHRYPAALESGLLRPLVLFVPVTHSGDGPFAQS